MLFLALIARLQTPAPPRFDFARTMRVDYFHSGGPRTGESFSVDRVVNDGAWAGSRTQLVDRTDLGKYLFEVRDAASDAAIYSRGFASVYGEWETTPEVKTAQRTFHESLRFPWPSAPVKVTLKKRQTDNSFASVWTTEVDPASRFVNRAPMAAHAGQVWPVFVNGPAAQKVDLLVISEGYSRAQIPKFHADVKRLLNSLFAQEPFKSRRTDFNVRALESAVPRTRDQPPKRRRVPPHAAFCRIQRVRLGALRADARQPCASRRGVGRAL